MKPNSYMKKIYFTVKFGGINIGPLLFNRIAAS
jgi:hypothetical protein